MILSGTVLPADTVRVRNVTNYCQVEYSPKQLLAVRFLTVCLGNVGNAVGLI